MNEAVDGHLRPTAGKGAVGTGTPRSKAGVTLTGAALAAAEALAAEHGVSTGEVVRRALAVFKFIHDETAKGAVLKIQSPNGDLDRIQILFT